KIGPDPRNFNQRVSLGRNDLLIRTFPREVAKWKSALDELKSNELISSRDYKGVQFEVTHKGWTLFESLKNK
ncbi:hypothetical protein V6187_16800, partial [Escherichia coli]